MDSDEPIDISRHIWQTKYRSAGPARRSAPSWTLRVALPAPSQQLSAPTPRAGKSVSIEFCKTTSFKFLPGGRVQVGAGIGHDVTLFNRFIIEQSRIPFQESSVRCRKQRSTYIRAAASALTSDTPAARDGSAEGRLRRRTWL
jgi:hypothetical protein